MRVTKDPEIRKQEILETALLLFEERGIQKTAMSDIAAKAGVAKGLLYYYYRSKEDLLAEVIEVFSKEMDDRISAILADGALDFYQKLGAVVALFFSAITDHPALMSVTPGNPGVYEFMKTRLCSIAIHQAKSLLTEAAAQGILKIAHPEAMLKVLIYGIADLYGEGTTDPVVLTSIIEQALGLEAGKLQLPTAP
ncbi:TetR/AcrR family transcriptional regulator [Proteiniclasticum sp. BAD-10]|uniref:TetR/AcrR family transcriptional regulator n=1 Tax=Proteiniclasticum sediminis TaxID=2804028 RepID=A0A941CN58_9CLOT|nr:TetR/AcrR family transcriptional regulator [Proteiniclasticum sediminis]MBR0575640.1 TetR/AcrR family transcriptional regulator [Proteiniclasticum sediminis]